MNREQLRGNCLDEIQVLDPGHVLPNVNDVLMKSLRDVVRGFGGYQRTAVITTVSGQRECRTSEGFPSDFLSYRWCFRSDGIELDVIDRDERSETGTGTPSAFYIEEMSMGFDVIPNGITVLAFGYYGTGDDVTDDVTALLPDLALQDNDPLWQAVNFAFAQHYYSAKLAEARRMRDFKGIQVYKDAYEDYSKRLGSAKWRLRRELKGINERRGRTPDLPADYFPIRKRTSFEERASNDGDRTRTWR